MPSVLTHDFFGRDVYGAVGTELGFTTTDEMDAFLLGNQGPDPLFYLVLNPLFDKSSHVGTLMHDEKPSELLLAMRTAIEGLDGDVRRICRAYAAGFLCHYLLDRTTHPFIFAQQNAICASSASGLGEELGGTVHANIEREIDEMMLYRKRSCTVAEYNPCIEVLRG
ncbi:MAG: zinc dependent phospholipase C family protein, partial [Atopobiaceae bacterium]|nr:zinc dependent phospholipase C family protein [Atopobiaceae bacterium]